MGDRFPDVEVQPELMSFEGLWVDLVSMANQGVNTQVAGIFISLYSQCTFCSWISTVVGTERR